MLDMQRLHSSTICIGLLAQMGCHASRPVASPAVPGQITQVSVINALMLGQYDGVMPVAELLRFGNFGLGTLDRLDGELIVLDGTAYQVRGDGTVKQAAPDWTTPFAVVTPFEADGELRCPAIDLLSALDDHLDRTLRRPNNFVAVRVDGRFASISLRSVHRQQPPYRPLGEVAKGQSVWNHQDVSGTLVGIRCPAWVQGLNVPGYHWHFISNDRRIGGHVLDCQVVEGRVRYDICRNWMIRLGDSAEFNGANLGQDLKSELERVESSRGDGTKQGDPKR
jgi:acetolactate decarboxylase